MLQFQRAVIKAKQNAQLYYTINCQSTLFYLAQISETLIKTNEQLQNIDKAIKKLGSEEV